MLSERQLNALLERFEARMQGVTEEYLRKMGEHLKAIGKLSASDVNRLIELKRVGANVKKIKKSIAKAADANVKDVEEVFRAAAESDVRFAAKYFAESAVPAVKGAPKLSAPLERILKAQLRVTAQEFKNLSQTTILSENYRSAVDVAVQTAQTGIEDYNTAIRRAMKIAAADGLRVTYPNSGLTRRLDSAVRQNVLDGVRSLNNDILAQLGKEYGADGVEISAHALCAEDHLPYQGRQFSRKEFDRIQNLLDRPFGMWNCKHTIFPVILGVSAPANDADDLALYRQNSTEAITIDGRTKSRYQWSQEQRRIETAVRAQKDIAIAAKASGDDIARREAQAKINALRERYESISEKAGLNTENERMTVAGFRPVKVDPNLTYIRDDAKIKASSGLPKILKGLPDDTVKATTIVEFPNLNGVVPMGANIRSIIVMAGQGTSTPIHDLQRLYTSYPKYGNASDWQKKSGTVATENFSYEIHWYEANGEMPKDEIKIKRVKRVK